MRLPNDVSRCAGEVYGHACPQAYTCRRYMERPEGENAWWIHPQIPGPCAHYLPAAGPESASEPEKETPYYADPKLAPGGIPYRPDWDRKSPIPPPGAGQEGDQG